MFSIAADIKNTLGECPLWCERTRRLYWTDIEVSELLALEEDNDAVMRWSLLERLGSFALTERSHILLMGLASRLAFYELNTEFLSTVAASPGGRSTLNNHFCDYFFTLSGLMQCMTSPRFITKRQIPVMF